MPEFISVATHNMGESYVDLIQAEESRIKLENRNSQPEEATQLDRINSALARARLMINANIFYKLYLKVVAWWKSDAKMLHSVKDLSYDQGYSKSIKDRALNALKGRIEAKGLTSVEPNDSNFSEVLEQYRFKLTQEAFQSTFNNQDIICLQEIGEKRAGGTWNPQKGEVETNRSKIREWLPETYDYVFDTQCDAGIVWNKSRFSLVEGTNYIKGRGDIVVKLQDNKTNKTVIVASAHLPGGNPLVYDGGQNNFSSENKALSDVIGISNKIPFDASSLTILAMDFNVVESHPRMEIARQNGFKFDHRTCPEPTITNPFMIVPTKVDHIGARGAATIFNTPIHLRENYSDHQPVASTITY